MGLLDSFKGDGELRKEKELSVKRNQLEETVDKIMATYQVWLTNIDYGNACDQLQDYTINQATMDKFCLRLKAYQDVERFRDGGIFFSAMIQNAYGHGYNDLCISTQHLEININAIGGLISGKEDDPIRVTVDGDVGSICGFGAKHSRLRFLGNVGDWCGEQARYSHFTIQADAGNFCGEGAEHSHFTFNGDAGHGCGYGAAYSTFYSQNLEKLREMKPIAEDSCRFYLIEPDGSHTEVLR